MVQVGTREKTRGGDLARLGAIALAIALLGMSAMPVWAQGDSGDETAPTEVPKITEGFVPVLDFLRFIQHHTGKMVNYPSAPAPEQA